MLENDSKHAVIAVEGDYKLGREKGTEDAVIYFDKINNKVEVIGNNILAENMNINFRKKC